MAEEPSPIKKLSLIHVCKIGLRFAHWAGTVGGGWRADNNKVIQDKDKSQNFLKPINIV